MRIVEIREAKAALGGGIRNAAVDFATMTTSVVAAVSDVVRRGRRVTGLGFAAPGRYAQGGILRERFIPRVLAAAPDSLLDENGAFSPEAAWRAAMANEKPGGHGDRAVALAALDVAMWDLAGKLAGRPLWSMFAERANGGAANRRVAVYPGGGYYAPGKGPEALRDEILGYLDAGYRTVKIKIGGAPPAEDLRRVETAVRTVGDGARVAVDANGALDRTRALACAEMLAPFGLMWFEEPSDPLDYALYAEIAQAYAPPLATGECLMSLADARNLARHAGLRPDRDRLQVDPALCYGPTEYLRIVAMFDAHGWPRASHSPHGGHQIGLALAAGLQLGGCESYPGVFRPFGGFADDTPVEDGTVRVSDAPGLGIERKAALHARLRDLLAL